MYNTSAWWSLILRGELETHLLLAGFHPCFFPANSAVNLPRMIQLGLSCGVNPAVLPVSRILKLMGNTRYTHLHILRHRTSVVKEKNTMPEAGLEPARPLLDTGF